MNDSPSMKTLTSFWGHDGGRDRNRHALYLSLIVGSFSLSALRALVLYTQTKRGTLTPKSCGLIGRMRLATHSCPLSTRLKCARCSCCMAVLLPIGQRTIPYSCERSIQEWMRTSLVTRSFAV